MLKKDNFEAEIQNDVMQNRKQTEITLAILRIAVGWHFLFEGLVKVFNPAWTSRAYLLDSGGWFRNFFYWIAGNQAVLKASDFLNAWGLTFIGLAMVLGFLSRYAAAAGIFLLSLYYLSHPPFPGITYLFPSDGSYFVVNKTLIEGLLLLLIYQYPAEEVIGIKRIMFKK